MGVVTTFYVVYGIKIDWDDDVSKVYDKHFDEIEQDKNFSIIADNMCGEYIVLGKIVAHINEEYETEFKELSFDNEGWLKEQVFTGLNKYFDEDMVEKLITENQCKLYVFTHYS